MIKNTNLSPSTREKIVKTAQNLFIKNSYSSVSMNDIAKKLHLSKPALYYYFTSKEELYLEIISKTHEDYCKKIEKILKGVLSLKEKFIKILDIYLNIHCDRKHQSLCSSLILLQKLSRNEKNIISYINKAREQSLTLIEPLIKEIFKTNNAPAHLDSKLMFLLVSGSLNAYISDKTFLNNKTWTNNQVIEHITALVFKNKTT